MLSAIVVAAGRSNRFSRLHISKVLAKINSKPVIYYSLYALSRHPSVKEVIVVANEKNIKEIFGVVRRYRIKKVKKIILGGKERHDSVLNGLNSLSPKTSLVLIHDGARPFITKSIISSVITIARKSGAAIIGVPVKATIKSVVSRQSLVVSKTLNRKNLWEIQTPQVFKKELIFQAYRKFRRLSVTDDSMLVEKLGAKVRMVLGTYYNIKITTPEDLFLAKAIAKQWIRKRNL